MTSRVANVIGYTSGANAVFTFNGYEVFNGTVSSTGDPDNVSELFEFTIDETINGIVPVKLVVTGGTLTITTLSTDHILPDNPTFTEHLFSGAGSAKTNVILNGILLPDSGTVEEFADLEGATHVTLEDGDVMTADFNIPEYV